MSNAFLKQNLPVDNGKSEQYHWILHIRIRLGTKFQFKQTILIFGIKFAQKGYFCSKNEKSEHHYWIVPIWISLSTKFQLKVTILIFWTKFTQKGYFWFKTEKSHFCVRPWSLLAYLFHTGAKEHNGI